MGKYDFLTDSAQRVLVAHQLLDEALLVIKNIRTAEVGDPDLRELGRYLGSFHEAMMQSHRMVHRVVTHCDVGGDVRVDEVGVLQSPYTVRVFTKRGTDDTGRTVSAQRDTPF